LELATKNEIGAPSAVVRLEGKNAVQQEMYGASLLALDFARQECLPPAIPKLAVNYDRSVQVLEGALDSASTRRLRHCMCMVEQPSSMRDLHRKVLHLQWNPEIADQYVALVHHLDQPLPRRLRQIRSVIDLPQHSEDLKRLRLEESSATGLEPSITPAIMSDHCSKSISIRYPCIN
jgi:hypothetical protein